MGISPTTGLVLFRWMIIGNVYCKSPKWIGFGCFRATWGNKNMMLWHGVSMSNPKQTSQVKHLLHLPKPSWEQGPEAWDGDLRDELISTTFGSIATVLAHCHGHINAISGWPCWIQDVLPFSLRPVGNWTGHGKSLAVPIFTATATATATMPATFMSIWVYSRCRGQRNTLGGQGNTLGGQRKHGTQSWPVTDWNPIFLIDDIPKNADKMGLSENRRTPNYDYDPNGHILWVDMQFCRNPDTKCLFICIYINTQYTDYISLYHHKLVGGSFFARYIPLYSMISSLDQS